MITTSEFREPPVTICPPGKRTSVKLRPPVESPIRVITQTALESPERPRLPPPANGDRRSVQERIEAAERAEAVSVVLAQPHRAGSDDPRLAFPLGRLCASIWRNDPNFANRMWGAGVKYAADVRAVKVASGFHVIGSERDGIRSGANNGEDLSAEEIEAMRANRFGLELTLRKADDFLRSVMPRCPRAMVKLCFDHEEPSPYDTDILRNGLYRLSLHYGLWEKAPS